MKRVGFDDGDDAIACAKQLVDGARLEHFASAKSAHDLMTYYTIYGSGPGLAFHAVQYAREKADAMFAASAT